MPDRVAQDRRPLLQAVVVTLSVATYAALGIYLHWALHIHIVYSHAAHIPIVLAGIWWGRKGLAVAAIVACLPAVSVSWELPTPRCGATWRGYFLGGGGRGL
jgi:hypothetical protein